MPILNRKDLMYQIMENMTGMIRIVDIDNYILYMNRSMREEFGDSTGQRCHTMFCRDKKCDICISIDSIQKDTAQTKEVHYRDKVYRVIASPAVESDSERYSIEIFYDITEQKKLEEESRIHYEKLKGDIEFAKQIQIKTLPKDKVYWNSIRAHSAYSPSEDLSGDLFDIVRVNDECVLFYIADVSGHGVRSSLMTIFLRQIIRGMKAVAADPIAVLNQVIKDYKDLGLDKEQFISIIYGVYNSNTKGLSIVNAGHNCLPIVIENGEDKKLKLTELDIKGLPICSIISTSNHQVKTLQMEKGDRILLYTDGITEAFNNTRSQTFGTERLMGVIRSMSEFDGKKLVKQIIDEAKSFAGNSSMDDMAALILELI